jgi:hypothetical protein
MEDLRLRRARVPMRVRLFWLIPLWACCASLAQEVLPGTQPLTLPGDLSTQMVAGIDRFLTRETAHSIGERQQHWQRDFASAEVYDTSVQPNRERLRKIHRRGGRAPAGDRA